MAPPNRMVAAAVAVFCLLLLSGLRVQAEATPSEDGLGCALCQDAIVGVEATLESNHTQQDLVAALDKVCDALPASVKAKCLASVAELAPQLNQSLDSITTKYSPFALCSMLSACQVWQPRLPRGHLPLPR
jgi:hypothetical protein